MYKYICIFIYIIYIYYIYIIYAQVMQFAEKNIKHRDIYKTLWPLFVNGVQLTQG